MFPKNVIAESALQITYSVAKLYKQYKLFGKFQIPQLISAIKYLNKSFFYSNKNKAFQNKDPLLNLLTHYKVK